MQDDPEKYLLLQVSSDQLLPLHVGPDEPDRRPNPNPNPNPNPLGGARSAMGAVRLGSLF